MADLAPPSAASITTANPAIEKDQKPKPEKPDEEKYKTELAQAEKEHAAAQEKFNAVRAKIELAKPPNKESPVAKRQQELRSQLSTIRQQQSSLKSSKGNLQEKIRSLDTQLKSRINEQKNARSKVPYKSLEEVDSQIQRLEKQVDSGTMKLVDEKKALADISNLRKQKKSFAGFDDAQKGIDDVKAQLAELRKGLDDPEAKALSEKYNTIAKELDQIKAEQDEAYKNINSLRDERSKLHAEQQEKYVAIRKIKDVYYAQKKAFSDYEHQAYLARKERQKAERDAFEKEKRRKVAEQKLEESSQPAYLDQILTAEGLIRYFDPSSAEAQAETLPGKFAAQAQRTVEAAVMTGMKVMKKVEDDYFVGNAGKKGKKGKKGGRTESPATPAETGKMNLSIGVIEELAKVGVDPPSTQADVPSVVEKLKEKLAHWKSDQDRKTKENVDKAKKEIERLEAEAKASPSPSGSNTPITNGKGGSRDDAKKVALTNAGVGEGPAEKKIVPEAEEAQEKDAVADAAEELEKAKIEDATAPEGTA